MAGRLLRRIRSIGRARPIFRPILSVLFFLALWAGAALIEPQAVPARSITDAAGREVTLPESVKRVICSGPGCLRLLTYLKAHDRIVAVDSIEIRGAPIDARPYAIVNPQFRDYPLFGEFRGQDNPELIAALDPQPQVIFKTFAGHGQNPDRLQAKTGIPVITLEYGNLTYGRSDLDRSLRLMARVMGVEERAEEIIAFFNNLEQDLRQRTEDIPPERRPACYVGGLGQRGPHGFESTEPFFAPFAFVGARNTAALDPASRPLSHALIAREEIVFRDPEVIFLDLSTMDLGSGANALDQLRTDPTYRALTAVRKARVYGLFPYNSYTQNFETVFANAYYVGKVLYPDRFGDVDPMARAEEISVFLNGGPSFARMRAQYDGLPFTRLELQ